MRGEALTYTINQARTEQLAERTGVEAIRRTFAGAKAARQMPKPWHLTRQAHGEPPICHLSLVGALLKLVQYT